MQHQTSYQNGHYPADDPIAIVRIALADLVRRIDVRSIKPSGVERLKQNIQQHGYRSEKPVLVAPLVEGYLLIDGGHRVDALLALGETHIYAVVDPALATDEDAQLHAALAANVGTEALVPTMFTDHAELIWRLRDAQRSQATIARILGWARHAEDASARVRVAQYEALRKLTPEVWERVKTTMENAVTSDDKGAVTSSVTPVTFTEHLLRPLLDLPADQQRDLVERLAEGRITKGKVKQQAERYKQRNALLAVVDDRLAGVDPTFPALVTLREAVTNAGYDDETPALCPKLEKGIAQVQDEWEKKVAIRCLHGDFLTIASTLPAGSVDLIVTLRTP